ncbi:MAG: hypothetical protein AAGU27_18980 [Dehalobacterium sp.]
MIFIMIMGFIIAASLEVPGLIKRKWWKELFWYSFFLINGFILTLLLMLGVEFPDISHIITSVVNVL